MPGTFTCSEDEDFGSLGDNKVIVTGGTGGSPATFDDFVTADRAGEAVLLAATAGLSPTLALTAALRPVDVTALLISFIVASKTTETDHIFITGTDWRAAAQTESIDVSAGNATYVSTKYFATISNIDCSDNASGGGTQWADGTVRVTQAQWGLIWDHRDGDPERKQFRLSGDFDAGDGSTTTVFIEADCQLVIDTTRRMLSVANGTVNFGAKLTSTIAQRGCHIINIDDNNSSSVYTINGTWNMFNSLWSQVGSSNHFQMHKFKFNGTHEFIQSTIYHRNRPQFAGTLTVVGLTVPSPHNGIEFFGSPTFTDSQIIADQSTLLFINQAQPDIVDTILDGSGVTDMFTMQGSSCDVDLIDCTIIGDPAGWNIVGGSGQDVWEKATVNIHVGDRAGADLQSVTVLCENEDDTQAFSVTTDANGDISEQTVSWKHHLENTGAVDTTVFSPHKFTLSKAGYKTLIVDLITLDAPIKWHLELQSNEAPPRAWRH